MRKSFGLVVLVLTVLVASATAQLPSTGQKVPVGVPADAKLFRGKWYRVYLERTGWSSAKQRCTTLGGQLAVVPDAATWAFISSLASHTSLWLGATDEETEGLWKWIDGTPFTFKAWLPGQPDNWWGGVEHFLHTRNGGWNDAQRNGKIDERDHVVGFICEWKDK